MKEDLRQRPAPPRTAHWCAQRCRRRIAPPAAAWPRERSPQTSPLQQQQAHQAKKEKCQNCMNSHASQHAVCCAKRGASPRQCPPVLCWEAPKAGAEAAAPLEAALLPAPKVRGPALPPKVNPDPLPGAAALGALVGALLAPYVAPLFCAPNVSAPPEPKLKPEAGAAPLPCPKAGVLETAPNSGASLVLPKASAEPPKAGMLPAPNAPAP